ncbi:MAG: hypothetical protein ACR2RL_06410 [Gammaproteobacteria bacterium]
MDVVNITLALLADLTAFLWLLLRPHRGVAAENLFLRRQLAMYRQRGVEPRRTGATTRIALVVLACRSRIRLQAAIGSWTNSRQCDTQRKSSSSAGLTISLVVTPNGVLPSNDAWTRSVL